MILDFRFSIFDLRLSPAAGGASQSQIANLKSKIVLLLVLAVRSASAAWGHYQTLDFDLTKNDPQAYSTDIPAGAFTPNGLKLEVKPGVQYSLTSKREFADEFDFDVQIEIVGRNDQGEILVELILVSDQARRKVVGTFTSHPPGRGADSGALRYFKDGQAAGRQWDNHWADASHTTGYDGAGTAPFEWLRIHKAQTKVWFLQKLKGQPYRWDASADYPRTDYFNEDCESFKLAFAVRCAGGATGTVLIKTMRVSGGAVLPRDPTKREFHLDFGPVNQELEDEFMPVNEYTMYTPQKGYGWVIPEYEKVWRGEVPRLSDKEIAAAGYPPIVGDHEGWYTEFLRQCYWLERNDRKVFYSTSHGNDFVEFYKKYIDLKTPLERDFVGMARPFHFCMNPLYQKDVEERRGSLYIDDDLSADFVVDLPNGNYNAILGVGYSQSLFGGSETRCMNVEINGRVRQQELGPYWRRTSQHPIRNILVENGKMDFRFFVDVRKCMGPYWNHHLATGWMINYIVILPAEEKELMNEWEWRIIKRRGEIIRRVTFVEGEPAVTRLENGTKHAETQAPFISLNGKPWYFCKVQNNYVQGDTDYVEYYCLANAIHGYTTVKGSQHFFKPDWEKLSYSDDYPWDMVDRMNVGYTWRCLTSLALEDIISFVPHAVMGEGTPTMDSRGRRNRWNIQPPLNSALGKEIQKEAYTMMSNQLGPHPAKAANYIYEELWHPDEQGYDDQSLIQYWDWLKRKYTTIEALNKEWQREYKSFDEILQPTQGKNDFWQFTPEFVNFRKFRGWAQEQTIKSACDLAHRLEPRHFAWGAKGDFGTQSYYPGEFLDMFGWYSPEVAASVARRFNKAAIMGAYMLNCEYAYLDGRKQFDHKPGPRRYLGKEEVNTVYNKLVSSVFKGVKGFYNEWYSDGMCHFLHRTEMIGTLAPKYKIIHWTGQLAFYEPGAFEGPPVNMERQALYASCANKMLYRLAPLWLPARPLEPRVLYPLVETSFFLDILGAKPYADFEEAQARILRSSNIPADFLNVAGAGDLSKYKLIVIGDGCQAIPRADAERIRNFVLGGGKLIILNGGGFTNDERPQRFKVGRSAGSPGDPAGRPTKDAVFPLEEFAGLGGYDIVCSNSYHMPLGKVAATFADGQPLAEWGTQFYYVPREGSQVFLKGVITGKDLKGKEVALGILSKAGNVAVVQTPPKEAPDEAIRPLSRWFRKLLDSWKIDERVRLGGVDDEWDLYSGLLTGDGYYLVAVCNLAGTDTNFRPFGNWLSVPAGTKQKVSLKIKELPPGDYTVEDVTGDHPDLMRKADGGIRLKEDPANRQTRIDYTLSAQQLADGAIQAEIAPLQARVYLLRPAAEKVWVSIWKPSLTAFVRRPVTIAYGSSPADKSGAETIREALAKVGVKASAVPAAEVKRKKLRFEVRVNPGTNKLAYHEDRSKWYLMDTFDNEVVDSDNNFFIVGSEETNELLKHLGKDGAFVYDKVLEKISAKFPGPGRGLIGAVECINSATYDPRSQSRDAIIAGGSDEAGTKAAVNALAALIAQYGQDALQPAPTPPGLPAHP